MILFICKKRHAYEGDRQVSFGLIVSAKFVVDMLLFEGVQAKLVEAVDGNSIDALVHKYKPKKVVLEAIWVTPAKLKELKRLHPKVQWTVRVHSETPFLANEGMAVEWILAYKKLDVEVSFNSFLTSVDFGGTYLPNYYPLRKPRHKEVSCSRVLNVGCFGAIRPLKNQLVQAIAAQKFAEYYNYELAFHMNGSRIEQNGNNVLKNISALLGKQLVLHPWLQHNEFLELISKMDICLSVSLSESFCITASDAVSMGVPLVGSNAIQWLPKRSRADVNHAGSIIDAMGRADKISVELNREGLFQYLVAALETWMRWVNKDKR